jgi:hypothetical protein
MTYEVRGRCHLNHQFSVTLYGRRRKYRASSCLVVTFLVKTEVRLAILQLLLNSPFYILNKFFLKAVRESTGASQHCLHLFGCDAHPMYVLLYRRRILMMC